MADGHYARADGFTSLAVLFGALEIWMGCPLSYHLIGIFITIAILRIVQHAGKPVFSHMLDGVESDVINEIY